MNYRYIAAIEIAGSQVRGAVARVPLLSDGSAARPEVVALETADSNGCVLYGRVQNLIEAAKQTQYVLQKLENTPAVKPGKITEVYAALAGRSLGTIRANAELDLPTEMEVTDQILERLYMEATKAVPAGKAALKVMPRKFFVDNRAISAPVGALGKKIRGEFTVVVCSPANRRNLELVLDERLHMDVAEYVLTPLSTARLLLNEEEKQLGCCLVDIGAHTTTMSIYKDRSLQYIVTLPLGSHNITLDIAAGLSITAERAEQAKCTVASATSEPGATADADIQRANLYTQARAGEIAANIMAHISFAGFRAEDLASGMVMTGRGAKLKNFCRFLESQSKMKIRLAGLPATIAVAPSVGKAADYIPLLSVIEQAARTSDEQCVSFPEPEPAPQPAPPAQQPNRGADVHFGAGPDEEDLLEDDDVAARRRAQRAQQAQQQEQERIARERAAQEAMERKRARQLAQQNTTDSLDDTPDDDPDKKDPSFMDKMQKMLLNIFSKHTNVDDDRDADLEDEV